MTSSVDSSSIESTGYGEALKDTDLKLNVDSDNEDANKERSKPKMKNLEQAWTNNQSKARAGSTSDLYNWAKIRQEQCLQDQVKKAKEQVDMGAKDVTLDSERDPYKAYDLRPSQGFRVARHHAGHQSAMNAKYSHKRLRSKNNIKSGELSFDAASSREFAYKGNVSDLEPFLKREGKYGMASNAS